MSRPRHYARFAEPSAPKSDGRGTKVLIRELSLKASQAVVTGVLLMAGLNAEPALAQATQIYSESQLVEAELEDGRGGQWVIKLIAADGAKQKLYLDAHAEKRKPRPYKASLEIVDEF